MANPQERAWSEGYKAGKHNEPMSKCPYRSGMAMQAWMQGWRNGQQSRDAKDI